MPETLQQRAQAHFAFDAGTSAADRLAVFKLFLKEEIASLRARHEAGASGLEIARARAEVMDVMLRRLFDDAAASLPRDSGVPAVALVALGGYGRGELSPWSDLDVMLLFPAKTKDIKQRQIMLRRRSGQHRVTAQALVIDQRRIVAL